MKVEIIREGYGFQKGAVVKIVPYMARLLARKGFATPLPEEVVKKVVKKVPKKKGKK